MINSNASKEEHQYPIYVQVTYNRKNTKFRLLNILMTEKEFCSEKTFSLLEDSKQRLERIVRLENELLSEDFELKGIGGRLSKYMDSVMHGLIEALLSEIGDKGLKLIDSTDSKIKLNGKANFFFKGLAGFVFSSTFSDSIEKLKENAASVVEFEQIGGSLLSREVYNTFFTDDIKGSLKAFTELYDNHSDNDKLYATDILSWMEDTKGVGNIETIQTIRRLLSIYLNE